MPPLGWKYQVTHEFVENLSKCIEKVKRFFLSLLICLSRAGDFVVLLREVTKE